MRFSAIHKASTYLMVLAAFGAAALSGELGDASVLGTLLGIAGSWFFEPPRFRPARYAFAWNVAGVLVLAYTFVAVLGGEPVVSSFARLLGFLLVAKLFSRVASRDYLWIYVLSFSLLVAGAALNGDFSYGVCFLAYAVFAPWALILFHLRREMEENFLLKHSDDSSSEKVQVERILSSRRIVGKAFLLGTSAVSLTVFFASTVFFFVFPRIGFGLFVQQSRAGITMAGFRDGVSLGGHGLIRSDTTVVMRVFLDDPRYRGAGASGLHWRGVAFDRYARGEWSRSSSAFRTRFVPEYDTANRRTRVHLGTTDGEVRSGERAAVLEAGLRQEIYLEPLDAPVLFGASRPLAFDVDARVFTPHVRRDSSWQNDEVRYWHVAGLRYFVTSDPEPPPIEALERAPDADPERLAPYLQLADEISPRVRELAARIVAEAGARTTWEKARAVERYLEGNYGYTLSMETDPAAEPLEHFLFERRRGHCEYFSTAMAILLRAVGVPTRNVNGFLGGEWNDYGGYLAVRGGDAHSWVEVYFRGVGWVTFDPTPAGGAAPTGRSGRGFRDRMRLMLDSIRLKWLQWVVDYDLGQQMGLMRQVADWVGGRGSLARLRPRSLGPWLRQHRVAIGGGLAAIGVLVVLLRWRRRGARPAGGAWRRAGPAHPVVALYLKTAARVARRGHPRPPARTPREHAAALVTAATPGARPFAALTELYYTARFAGDDAGPAPGDVEAARRLSAEVLEALRRRPDRATAPPPS